MDDVLLIAGNHNPAMADHAAYSSRQGVILVAARSVCRLVKATVELHDAASFRASELVERLAGSRLHLVVYLDATPSTLQEIDELARAVRPHCITLVSTFVVHLGDARAQAAEEHAVRLFQKLGERLVVFRPGHLVGGHTRLGQRLRRLPFLFAVLPDSLGSTCLAGAELFAALEHEARRTGGRALRVYTLLGPQRPWNQQIELRSSLARGLARLVRGIATLLLLGPVLALILRWLGLRGASFDTLRPASIKELLALYNPYNFKHVKVVGYNNGVVHFGQRFPGRTIVSTVHCDRLARVRGLAALFDGGVTIRKAMDVLAAEDKELHVLPNYSYVTLGTAFFVPIHGSASQFCTIGATIDKAWLYDPRGDRVLVACAGDALFSRYLFNLHADVLLLRVQVKVKERSRYAVKKESLSSPSPADVWGCFHDQTASNVEIRKAGSAARAISVYRYYADDSAVALDVPRDRLGSLWDRLEENPLTSVLFHGLTRCLAHHVELFLSRAEFEDFWNTHAALAIAKIQLRYIKRDGLPSSPFRDHDCVSADLFMLKRHRRAFQEYVRRTLPAVKMNPGKHSR